MIRILIVDDQKMIREALKVLLEPEKDFQIVGTADNGITALSQVEELEPDIVLMNIEMPGLDGSKATQAIASRFPHTKILILSSYDSDEYISKSLAVGAKGYLLKDTSSQDIVAAIRSINRGYTQIGPGLLEKLLVQTDSGVIINKLRDPSQHSSNLPAIAGEATRETVTLPKSRNAVVRLQSASRQQQIEIDKFRTRLQRIERDLPKIKRVVSSYSQQIRNIWMILLASMPIIFLVLFSFYNRINNIEENSIPLERIGLYGELHLSGLAQRVTRAFELDTQLTDISDIYVAQKGSTIVLKGSISSPILLDKLKNVAENVEGVSEVDTSFVQIK